MSLHCKSTVCRVRPFILFHLASRVLASRSQKPLICCWKRKLFYSVFFHLKKVEMVLTNPDTLGRNGVLLGNVVKYMRLRFELPTNDHYLLSLRCLQFITCVSVLSITLQQTRLIFDMSSIELHFSEEATCMPLPRVECFCTKKGEGHHLPRKQNTHIRTLSKGIIVWGIGRAIAHARK